MTMGEFLLPHKELCGTTSIFSFSFCCSTFLPCLKKWLLVFVYLFSFISCFDSCFLSLMRTSSMHPYLSLSTNLLPVLVFPPSFERTEDLVTSSYRQKFAISLPCTLTPNGRHTSENFFFFFKALGCFKNVWTVAVQNVRAGGYIFVWHSLC